MAENTGPNQVETGVNEALPAEPVGPTEATAALKSGTDLIQPVPLAPSKAINKSKTSLKGSRSKTGSRASLHGLQKPRTAGSKESKAKLDASDVRTPLEHSTEEVIARAVQDPLAEPGSLPPASMVEIAAPLERTGSQQDAREGQSNKPEKGEDNLAKALDDVQAEIKSNQEIETWQAGACDATEMVPEELEENPAYAALRREMANSPVMESRSGYIFTNQGFDMEEDMPVIDLCAPLSRAGSNLDAAEQKESEAAAEATIPIIRPSSPAQAGAHAVQQTLKGASEALQLAADGAVDAGGEETATEAEQVVTAAEAGLPEPIFVEAIDREAVISQIRNVLEQKERLRSRNILSQNKLAEHFRRKRADETRDTEKSVTDQEQRYANCIAALKDLKAELDALNTTNQKIESEHTARLEEKRQDTLLRAQEFIQFKRQVALSAENSRTGKPLQSKQVEQLEANEARKEAEVVVVRLENIKLRNRLRRHEQLLRQKEELAEGLHLIDFEQLKIENTTYNEKIEERNEELLKLRKKITNIVQVLTHVKEKLQFVQGEVVEYREKLKFVDAEMVKMRDTLPQIKQERDRLRNENVALKQRNGLLGNEPLLRDYEFRVDDAVALNARIDHYRAHHAELSAETLVVKRNIQKALQS